MISGPRLDDFAMADDAVIRVVDQYGRPLAATDPAADLGAAEPQGRRHG